MKEIKTEILMERTNQAEIDMLTNDSDKITVYFTVVRDRMNKDPRANLDILYLKVLVQCPDGEAFPTLSIVPNGRFNVGIKHLTTLLSMLLSVYYENKSFNDTEIRDFLSKKIRKIILVQE